MDFVFSGCAAGQRMLCLCSIGTDTELKLFTSGLTGSKKNVKINNYQILHICTPRLHS